MNVDNARLKFNQARATHTQALQAIEAITRNDDAATVSKLERNEREAWHKMDAARHGLIDAILEDKGL